MKKSIFALATLALLWTGCMNELNPIQNEDGETVKVTVSTVLEQAGKSTRAVWDNDGNGACVDHWIMEVYDAQGQLFDRQEKTEQKGLTNSFDITLIKNQSYQFAFWADTKGMYDTEDLRDVKTVKHKAGLDKRDAFFAEVDYTSTKSETLTAQLYRPFAQVNVVTLDLAKLYSQMEKAGTTADYDKFIPQTIKLKTTTYNKFNVLTGEVDSVETYALKIDKCYADYSAHKDTTTIFMDYGFAAVEKEVKDMKFSFISNGEEISYNFTNIPVQRNYRTNISGNLLSNDATWKVEIIPAWEKPDYEVPYYVATSIKDAQDYITKGTDGTKEVDLTSAIITDDDINMEDKTIHFVLTENSPKEIVNFTLPAIPAELAGCEGWTIESSKDGYPTKNVGVNAPKGTKVVINTPSSHVAVTGTNYARIIASTADNTLVISEGVTVKELIVKKGAVEIHGTVKTLKVEPESGAAVCFRACEGLSAEVFKIVKDYIDPFYKSAQNEDGSWNISMFVLAVVKGKGYASVDEAVAAAATGDVVKVYGTTEFTKADDGFCYTDAAAKTGRLVVANLVNPGSATTNATLKVSTDPSEKTMTFQTLWLGSASRLDAPGSYLKSGDILVLPAKTFYLDDQSTIYDVYGDITFLGMKGETVMKPWQTSASAYRFFRLYNRYKKNITDGVIYHYNFKDVTFDGSHEKHSAANLFVVTSYNIQINMDGCDVTNFPGSVFSIWANETLSDGSYPTKEDNVGVEVNITNSTLTGNGRLVHYDCSPYQAQVDDGLDRYAFIHVNFDETCTLSNTEMYDFNANTAKGQGNCLLNGVDVWSAE